MESALFALRVLIALILCAFFGLLLFALLRESRRAAGAGPLEARLMLRGPDGGAGRVYILQSPTWIGRDPNCAVQLRDDAISARHARLDWRADQGAWVVEDNVSRNGTFVNGARVNSAALRTGDELRVAETAFLVEIEDA